MESVQLNPGQDGGLLTNKQVAQFLALSLSKVYELQKAGALKFVQIGGVRRTSRTHLDEFIQHHTQGGAA